MISSQTGQRVVPFTEFFTGVKRTVLRADEILEEIVVPPETADARGSYRKLKRIKGHDLGIVGVAALNKDGALRLGISSCAPTPLLVDGPVRRGTRWTPWWPRRTRPSARSATCAAVGSTGSTWSRYSSAGLLQEVA